jgi:hypothetical protein
MSAIPSEKKPKPKVNTEGLAKKWRGWFVLWKTGTTQEVARLGRSREIGILHHRAIDLAGMVI